MEKPVTKSIKKRVLNSRLLPIAAIVLIVLALLFMATPLLRTTRGFQRTGNFAPQGSGQSTPPNGFQFPAGGSQGQGFPGQNGSNFQNQRFALRAGFLSGITGAFVFFGALLVSLVAALGMFYVKRWGQVLGMVMAVLYGLVGLVILIPILQAGSLGLRNPFSLILGIVSVLLAVAVIVLAAIPAKQSVIPAAADRPTAGTA
jgi:hypothetical protein